MRKPKSKLNDIVKLKKRIAESEFLSAQNELQALDEQLRSMRAQIDNASSSGLDVSGAELETAHLFVSKQIKEIRQLAERRHLLVSTFEEARTKLQGIIMSESVLEKTHM